MVFFSTIFVLLYCYWLDCVIGYGKPFIKLNICFVIETIDFHLAIRSQIDRINENSIFQYAPGVECRHNIMRILKVVYSKQENNRAIQYLLYTYIISQLNLQNTSEEMPRKYGRLKRVGEREGGSWSERASGGERDKWKTKLIQHFDISNSASAVAANK